MSYKPVDKNGIEVKYGQEIVDFRGDRFIFHGGRPPQCKGKSGKVWVTSNEYPNQQEYYDKVFGISWKEQP